MRTMFKALAFLLPASLTLGCVTDLAGTAPGAEESVSVRATEISAPISGEVAKQSSGKTYFMFVQTASSGRAVPLSGNDGRYELTLEGVSPSTIYFSDRPERITGHTPVKEFLEGLGFSSENPPNAASEVQAVRGETMIVVAELTNPRWDENASRLIYEIEVLKEGGGEGLAHYDTSRSDGLPQSFGATSVFIDDCPDKPVFCFRGTVRTLQTSCWIRM